MKKLATFIVAAAATLGSAVWADEGANLVVNGELELAIRVPAPAHLEGALGDTIMSGWVFRTDETQSLQMDDFDNPGLVLVEGAIDAWETAEGTEGKSCASCHGAVEDSMAGLRAVTPRYDEEAGGIMTIEDYINKCRTERMGAEKWSYSSQDIAKMVGLISMQSRGMPVNVAIDGPAAPYWEQGKEMFYTRYGQLELSCASCHEVNWGNYIRSDHLSQAQTNGMPVYRLKDAKLTTPHNRFKGCIRDTRAETFSPGSDEFRALELYVASRGNGLAVEGVSVRH